MQAGTAEGPRERMMVVNSGIPVYRFNFWTGEEYFLQLSLEAGAADITRLKGGPVTINHERDVRSTIGVIEDAFLEDGVLKARARFAETPDVEEVWQKIATGILRQVSVEANIAHTTKAKEKHEGLALYLADQWTPEAVSVVPVGADRNAILMNSCDFEAGAMRETVRAAVCEVFEQSGTARELGKVLRELRFMARNVRRISAAERKDQ